MAWTALGFALLLVGVLGTLVRRRGRDEPAADWVVEPVRLLAPVEQELYAQLRLAFPNHLVLTQVSLAKLLRMRRSRGSRAAFQRYERMAAPFVVCTKESMPLVVVDVHATRDVPKPSREQARRAAVLRASGLVYLAVAAVPGAVPAADVLRRRVRNALQAKPLRPAASPSAAAVANRPTVGAAASAGNASPRAPARAPLAARPLEAATNGVRRLMRPLLAARTPAATQPAKAA